MSRHKLGAPPPLPSPGAPFVTTPPPPPDDSVSSDEGTRNLAALGAESDTERAVKRIVPWVVSVAIHAGIVTLGFVATWTVVMLQGEEEPVLIVADFNAVMYEPVVRTNLEQADELIEPMQDRVEIEMPLDLLDDQTDLPVDPIMLISDAASDSSLARFAPDPTRMAASFVGLSSTNARRIVYVIDASGSMIRSLPIVIEELARSLDGLSRRQEFSVIFFQRNDAVIVPPAGRLSPGTESEKIRVLSWIDENVIPQGRSNPLAALEKALDFKPEVIFLLSENITGSGEFEIDQVDLLTLLDELNPIDASTGRRATQINCVQFLDPDPLRTLEKIAEAHGGENGYKFLDRRELGLKAP